MITFYSSFLDSPRNGVTGKVPYILFKTKSKMCSELVQCTVYRKKISVSTNSSSHWQNFLAKLNNAGFQNTFYHMLKFGRFNKCLKRCYVVKPDVNLYKCTNAHGYIFAREMMEISNLSDMTSKSHWACSVSFEMFYAQWVRSNSWFDSTNLLCLNLF